MFWVLKKNRLNETSSFEHPKHMLKIMGKKVFTILRWNFLLIETYVTVTIRQGPSDLSGYTFVLSALLNYIWGSGWDLIIREKWSPKSKE